MYDSLGMGRGQSFADLGPEAHNLSFFQSSSLNPLIERLARNELHGQEVHSPLRVEVEHRGNVRVIKLRKGQGFVTELFAGRFISQRADGKNFESDITLEVFVM